MSSICIDKLLKNSTQLLKKLSDSPALDSEVLLLHALNKLSQDKSFCRTFLRTWPEYEPTEDQLQFFNICINERIKGKPVAYITGFKEFWSLKLQVTPDTLIPRPDTEILVEQALALIPEQADWKVLDLGTGSGAIALAIACERKNCQIFATDKSIAALQVAHKNALRLNINNCHFIHGSWLDAFALNAFQIIVSNPPYIRETDPHLKQHELQHEPISALTSTNNGLDDIQHIISHCTKHLIEPGYLLLEHGFDQAEPVKNLLLQHHFYLYSQVNDYADMPRVSIGKINQ
jgi:release factor glutamine methyltransferase